MRSISFKYNIKYLIYIIFFILLFITKYSFNSSNVYTISGFINPAQSASDDSPDQQKKKLEKAQNKMSDPGKLNCSLLKGEIKKCKFLKGIYVTLGGYFTTTDQHGYYNLPRTIPYTEIPLVITKKVQPVPELSAQGTIHHFQIVHPEKSKIYTAKLKEEQESEIKFWHISESKFNQNRIPHNALIIFTNPHKLEVPLGAILNKSNMNLNQDATNLVLPTFYLESTIEPVLNTFSFFKVKKFFSPVKRKYKYYPDRSRYSEQIITGKEV